MKKTGGTLARGRRSVCWSIEIDVNARALDFCGKIEKSPRRKSSSERGRAEVRGRGSFLGIVSGRATERDAGKMPTTGDEIDFEVQLDAGLPFDECLRFGARRAAGQRGRGSKRGAIGVRLFGVDFIGRRAVEGHVRTGLIIPVEEQIDFGTRRWSYEGHGRQSAGIAVLERENESLADGGAAR